MGVLAALPAEALCGSHSRRCAGVVSAFAQELSRSLRHRAKQHLALGSVSEAHTGSVVLPILSGFILLVSVFARAWPGDAPPNWVAGRLNQA